MTRSNETTTGLTGQAGAAPAELSAVKRALAEIRSLKARLAAHEAAATEPIAIVGLALRVPGGVADADSFADLLFEGRDAIGPIPADRWDRDAWFDADADAPGRMYTREGGFIDGVDRFDADFFGISPVEAASLDPQQRLLLELAWEALEDAGHAPDRVAGSATGVYVGLANNDYGRALFARPEQIDPYFSQGNAYSVASGRIAYLLGLAGPAISIDTACSSSLVALHLACRALRAGDCDRALAGGVNLILTPEVHVTFCKAGMLARDHRCKTFDAAADGYVRGEGGALVVLRRLSDAVTDGDRILALVRGTAINQDGRSNGLTAPSGPAQQAVLRAALADAGVAPAAVGYVEAHGTGTALGDPIEVNALGAVYADGRDAAQPLVIGSVKSNVGHLEAAAGVVGLIKAVIALQRREIPPHLHFRTPNPHVDWTTLPITVATRRLPWPTSGGPVLAGVSSFGFSGTNAHVILEAAPVADTATPAAAGDIGQPKLLPLSARDPAALASVVAAFRSVLDAQTGQDPAALADICFTAATGRQHFRHRVAVAGRDAAALSAALAAWEAGRTHPGLITGTQRNAATAASHPTPPRVAFLFPGQGCQYPGMARGLYASSPIFREALDRCAAVLDRLLPKPLLEIVFGAGDDLERTAFVQPAVFAISWSLARTWRAWGIEPDAVMGHSFGEFAAACFAGAIGLEDAARMVVTRGRLAQALPDDGAMAVIEADEADVAGAIARRSGPIAIAAINGAKNTVVSGAAALVADLSREFAQAGARVRPLRVSHAFHSPLMDPILDRFEAGISDVGFAAPQVPLVSNLTGRDCGFDELADTRYWRRHLREPVRFAEALRSLARRGITHYIELGPQPVLLAMASEILPESGFVASLRQGVDDETAIAEAVQSLYCAGVDPDWAAWHRDAGTGRRRALPTYPFQRRRHWFASTPAAATAATPRPGPAAAGDAATRAGPDVAPEAGRARLARILDREAARAPVDVDIGSYPAKWACLERLVVAVAADALVEAGLFGRAGECHDLEGVMSAAGYAATYRHLVRRWLDRLVAAGELGSDGGSGYRADAPLRRPDLAAVVDDAARRFADNVPLFDYVRHCVGLAARVLRGSDSALETLFPAGSFELARGLYERSATMRYINQLAAAAVEAVATSTPAGHRLRVLELGAGTGGTTSSLLPVLPADRTDYLFTDVTPFFLDHARSRFGDRGWVRYGCFDLGGTASAQGLEPASVDLIIAANAVHAVSDLRATLASLRSLLAPGGTLVLVESTIHLAWFDVTTGLIEGWQAFADDLRVDHPLLAPAAWLDALLAAGFESPGAWPPAGSAAAELGQHVIVAHAPGVRGDAVVAVPAGAAAWVPLAPGAADDRPGPDPSPDAAGFDAVAWHARFAAAPDDERVDLLRRVVRDAVMETLRIDGSTPPDGDRRLLDLGLDSLMAVRLRNRLGTRLALSRPLRSTLVFDFPTIDSIAKHVTGLLDPTATAGPAGADSRTTPAPVAAARDTETALTAASVAAMSDEDIARLLDQRFASEPIR